MIKISGPEHLTASMQPEVLVRLLEALDEVFRALEALEDAFRITRRLEDLATKSSGACQTRGSGTAHRRRMS